MGFRKISKKDGVTTFDYLTFPGVPFVTTKPDGSSILGPPYPSDWTIGASDCVTLTYDAKLSGATMSLTKVNSCQDAVGLCKAKLGK